MLIAVGALIVLAIIFGPSLWVKFVMRKYSSENPEIPGTGGELAKHLIKKFSLKDVKVEVTELGDHYDPIEKEVILLITGDYKWWLFGLYVLFAFFGKLYIKNNEN